MSALDRDRRQNTSVVFSILVATRKESKETGEIDFWYCILLNSCIQNIIISTCDQEKLSKRYLKSGLPLRLRG